MIDARTSELMVCGRSLEVFLNEIEKFHGFKAPGVVIGGFMVDWAQELIGKDVEADAIVETYHCLPDAIQIFTPCTFGNGWMKILDWDKFALSLYDKRKLAGYRIWIDLKKLSSFSNIYDWYIRRLPKKELPLEDLLETILLARRSILSYDAIDVTRFYQRKKKDAIDVCSGCGEAYGTVQGAQCVSCQGKGYY